MGMDGLDTTQLACFNIISEVGSARSSYIEAIDCAIEDKVEEAERLIAEGDECYGRGHEIHTSLIQQEAAGEDVNFQLILLHAEDQLMSAETFKILAERFVNLARK